MAKLDKNSYPGNWGLSHGETWKDYSRRTEAMLDAIRGDVMRFPVADGYAFYYVKSRKPLVLQHVPYGDAWTIPDAHIRGLRLVDVDEMLEREANLQKIFSKGAAQ
jgi:hypothetical protein